MAAKAHNTPSKKSHGKNHSSPEVLLDLSLVQNQKRSKEALKTATKALEIAVKEDRKDLMARAHLQLAIYFCRTRTNPITSLRHCDKAIKLSANFKSKRELAEVFKTMGVDYYYLSDLPKAQDNYKNALDILLSVAARTNDEIRDIADIYYNLAILNKTPNTLHLRKEYLEQSQGFYRQINSRNGVARCYDGMAVYYFYSGDTKKAFEKSQKALKIFEEEKDAEGIYLACNNLGTLKIQEGKFDEGLVYLNRSLELRKRAGNPVPVAISHINIGSAYLQRKKYKEALKQLSLAEKILRKTKSKIELASLLLSMSECYRQLKDFHRALTCMEEYTTLREELHRYEIEKAYSDSSTHYDIELSEKDAQIDRLKNFELASYIHRLEMSNNELRQFAHAASHDLKEPLRTIISFVNLLEKHCDNKIDDTGRDYLYYILNASKRLDILVKDLLELSRINLSEIPFSEVNLNAVFEEVKKSLSVYLEERKVKLTASKLPIIKGDRSQMFQLFQNIIVNGIKYNENAAPEMKIKCVIADSHIKLSFADNGIGIPEEYQHKIFEIFQRLHPREKYSGTGVGLTICKRIVDRHHGKIWFEKNKRGGTVFYVQLPL